MNKKLLSILVCLAMLISGLSIFAYAATIEVEIDLGGLFDDEPVVNPDDGDDEDNDGKDDNNDGKGNGGPSRPNNEREEFDDNEEEVKEWTNPFSDVKENDWFFGTVKFASENGIMNGVSENEFAPNQTLTRAMLVTILYRVEGSPRLESDSTFSDVSLSDWYGAPIIWAAENGIVNGVSETEFAPNNAITREQIAAIMYRYANAKGYDVTQGGMAVREYEDYESISSWASEAMQWAVNTKLINGKTKTTVCPQDNATRAEAATIIMRFIEANK
ncbi:MAG: S-layer homology domain-containing protein [Ruminococcaceae bacterium]|nr:S-layer homology domain-containing protein [Oscillospiraceae bacterium]